MIKCETDHGSGKERNGTYYHLEIKKQLHIFEMFESVCMCVGE